MLVAISCSVKKHRLINVTPKDEIPVEDISLLFEGEGRGELTIRFDLRSFRDAVPESVEWEVGIKGKRFASGAIGVNLTFLPTETWVLRAPLMFPPIIFSSQPGTASVRVTGNIRLRSGRSHWHVLFNRTSRVFLSKIPQLDPSLEAE